MQLCKSGTVRRLPGMPIHKPAKQLYRALLGATVLAVTVAFSTRVDAQAEPNVGSIAGTISDSSIGPLSDISISALQGGHRSTTDAQGRFELDSIPPGEVTLIVSRRGYDQILPRIRVVAGQRTQAEEWIRPNGYESPARLLNRTDSAARGAYSRLDTTKIVSYVRFSIGLFRSVASDSPDSNVFISPASAALVLAMTAAGASGNTWTQMSTVLGVERMSREKLGEMNAAELSSLASQNGVTLNIANALWAAEGVPFSSAFLGQARTSYHADVHTQILHGSKTKSEINSWASRSTKGRIPAILDDTLPDTARMVLLNAVYFKGKWLDPFDSSETAKKLFHLSPRHAVQRQFMAREGDMLYAADTGMRVVRLPYQGGRVAMYIILPDSSLKVSSVVGRLSPARWAHWMHALRAQDVHLQVPRFRLETSTSFSKPLESLGMTAAFACDSAEFAEMLPQRYLRDHHMCISQVDQRAFVEVNEVGTEAAAVTMALVLSPTGIEVKPPPIEFIVDRPFIVAIRDDRTGLLLFIGQITDPKQQP
jgi:serine protease inhibitor